ncbi:MAG: hypothetical protein QG602_71 [Verrucomicrobiota bacterium]|nr:hypothetical protein [Verrucomicrobiota bacterium]
MQANDRCHFNLEWPAPGARLAGPVVWLRGWIVGKPGHDFVDVRVRHDGGIHRGVLGLPRVDLAVHFHSPRAWLPAEFILGVPVADGPAALVPEVMDSDGAWHALSAVALTVAPDGQPAPRVEGRLATSPDGTWTVRDAHHPFHGHLDQPGPTPQPHHGRAPVFGWLLDETRPLAAVLATTDLLVFNHLEHSLTDAALAVKVPHLPAARHARLRGEIDLPATLTLPACLRVYAQSPDGTVTLCFAQRITPATNQGGTRAPRGLFDAAYPNINARTLPDLPSARPRRVLLVLRSLWFDDATLRALDVARHLIASHRWAARVVSTEDGPLRQEFEQAGAESLIVNPAPLFAARDEPAAHAALAGLQRAIWWGHLDAVAVFDPVCGWALTLARRQGIPALFDCGADEPMSPDPTAIPAVQTLLRNAWREATGVCFASVAAARAQHDHLSGRPAAIIPQWHSPVLPTPPAPGTPRIAFAPLRTAQMLWRRHPEVAARWRFQQGSARLNQPEQLEGQDDRFNLPALQRTAGWNLDGSSLCLGPLFDRGPLRPVLDAATAGLVLAAPRTPTTAEWFAGTRLALVENDNPVALAHALLAHDAAPTLHERESSAAAERLRPRHDPAHLLPRWAELLASVAASRG